MNVPKQQPKSAIDTKMSRDRNKVRGFMTFEGVNNHFIKGGCHGLCYPL